MALRTRDELSKQLRLQSFIEYRVKKYSRNGGDNDKCRDGLELSRSLGSVYFH